MYRSVGSLTTPKEEPLPAPILNAEGLVIGWEISDEEAVEVIRLSSDREAPAYGADLDERR